MAREAGVATSTVSRAYARPGRVAAETARRIFEAAERLGYRSSRLDGGGPATGATKTIGLVISDVTNPYYNEIIRGAHAAAEQAGYLLLLTHTSESAAVERWTLERELSQVDGFVIASSRMSDSALRMTAKQKAVILLNRTIPEVSCVVPDNSHGIRQAASHLRALGHDSVLYLAGPETSWSDGIRWRALREAGPDLELEIRRLGPNVPTMRSGFQAARRIAEIGAGAVIAYNDQLAIGVIKGLISLGLTVPHDVSIVGFDNIVFDEIVAPGLTTVAAPLHQMGATGVRNCVAVARGRRPSGSPLVLPTTLVERGSTAARRGLCSRRLAGGRVAPGGPARSGLPAGASEAVAAVAPRAGAS
ncbi:LacI family DNA-binding transcriptional regulator [Parafrankia sp. EAN1pec]|uniref:LacI family DNA-binding transcriptional regulator n=1 Tax=Parafrankia sp. (strain EAN1pec) TaxID=298653 RepID=UPI0002D4ADC0